MAQGGCVATFEETQRELREGGPGYKCQVTECLTFHNDISEMCFCEYCQKRVCKDHARDIGDKLYICDDCNWEEAPEAYDPDDQRDYGRFGEAA